MTDSEIRWCSCSCHQGIAVNCLNCCSPELADAEEAHAEWAELHRRGIRHALAVGLLTFIVGMLLLVGLAACLAGCHSDFDQRAAAAFRAASDRAALESRFARRLPPFAPALARAAETTAGSFLMYFGMGTSGAVVFDNALVDIELLGQKIGRVGGAFDEHAAGAGGVATVNRVPPTAPVPGVGVGNPRGVRTGGRGQLEHNDLGGHLRSSVLGFVSHYTPILPCLANLPSNKSAETIGGVVSQ